MGAAPGQPNIIRGTGLVALLGHPVDHSLSPAMHNAAFRAQGIDMVYLAFDVDAPTVLDPRDGARGPGRSGGQRDRPPQADRHPVPRRPRRPRPHGWARSTRSSSAERHRRPQHRHSGLRGRTPLGLGQGGRRGRLRRPERGRGPGGGRRSSDEGPARSGCTTAPEPRRRTVCRRLGVGGWFVRGGDQQELFGAVAAADLIVNATSIGLGPDGQGVPASCRYLTTRQS